ncbi:hypothetical protein GRI38_06020 [Altererythrobacter aurantiacus]|uniref:Lipoprotein n=1 Tax=Parapontixanthobacter aurantiacus TaxID=1463599 RepID=A0A844ZE97_9SPHN|nr:hypothetical protein [Parapontixanthobacter aurantiacus]MXO85583.1 hypothetical protein [Parapontixanthobacter aurantiacus]
MTELIKKPAFLLLVLTALAGCEVASDMAGDAIQGEVRAQYLARCEGVAEGAGIAAERIASACECSADNFASDFAADGDLDINRARIEEVLQICVQNGADTGSAEG